MAYSFRPLFPWGAWRTLGRGAVTGDRPVTGVGAWPMSHIPTNQVQERADEKIHLC